MEKHAYIGELLAGIVYLLWALFGALQAFSCLVLVPQYSEYETTSQFTATWGALYGASIIASLVMIWLVFFPPIFYRNWIYRLATVADAAADGSQVRSRMRCRTRRS